MGALCPLLLSDDEASKTSTTHSVSLSTRLSKISRPKSRGVNTALALRHRRHGAVHCARRSASSRSSPHNVDRCADECGRRELFGSWLTLAHSVAVQQQCARVPFQFGLHSGS